MCHVSADGLHQLGSSGVGAYAGGSSIQLGCCPHEGGVLTDTALINHSCGQGLSAGSYAFLACALTYTEDMPQTTGWPGCPQKVELLDMPLSMLFEQSVW